MGKWWINLDNSDLIIHFQVFTQGRVVSTTEINLNSQSRTKHHEI